MKNIINKTVRTAVGIVLCASAITGTHASLLISDSSIQQPTILAGGNSGDQAPPVAPGDFTGVVSINIRYDSDGDGQREGFICTGSAIGKRQIVTAAHCVDPSGNGVVIDLNDPLNDVRVLFTDGGDWLTGDINDSLINASSVTIHPDYEGFGICGANDNSGFGTQCLNDDVAVIELSADIPEEAEIYDFYRGAEPLGDDSILRLDDGGTFFTMVGHGTGGNGIDGTAVPPNFFVKRFGFNIPEIFDCDDGTTPERAAFAAPEGCSFFYGNEAEVWRADFDGVDETGILQDNFCDSFGLGCGRFFGQDFTQLFEGAIGGGDSGGPSFVFDLLADRWVLIANNTFGPITDSSFGSTFGGNLYRSYLPWIDSFIAPVSAPASAMFLLSGLWLFRRKSI
ncbi:trypsin-like serine protease [Agaribacter flavus]|uniref:Trypsin-like serine protease n=1 Tax=Agaribacter flavus TaxID=1902781 RepID=A0ABV7FQW5_9ALTE